MQAKKKPEVFYVGIKDPIELRRSLLESSKEIVQIMQDFERFKEMRQQKLQLKEQLKKNVTDLFSLVRDLKKALPKTELRIKLDREHHFAKPEGESEEVMPNKKGKQKKTKAFAKKIAKMEPKEEAVKSRKTLGELDKLEEELKRIEDKLGTL